LITKTKPDLFAHSLNTAGKRQPLSDHLHNVAALAEEFAAALGEGDTARFIALVHDIGKAKGTWQERLIQLEAGLKPAFDEAKSDHKMAGSAYGYASSATVALVVAGHHGGIPCNVAGPRGRLFPHSHAVLMPD
jgi:CRISPR-associated endonuclease/helicase Cas3